MRHVTVLLLLLITTHARADDSALVLDQPVQGLHGEPTTLRALAGDDVLVLVILKGSWCPVCIEQLERLQARAGELGGAKLVALSADDPSDNRSAAASVPGVPIVSDFTGDVVRRLGLRGNDFVQPAELVYDRCGRVAFRHVGRGPGTRIDDELVREVQRIVRDPDACLKEAALAPAAGSAG